MVTIGKLTPDDRAAWQILYRGYLDFYENTLPPEGYDRAWREFQRDERVHALGARLDGQHATARRLYDQVAVNRGFIRYEVML